MQSYELEGLTQANEFLNRSNSAVMAQLVQMTVTTKVLPEKLNTLTSAPTNQTRPNRKYYCWGCRSNYNCGSKTYSSKEYGHKYET